MLVVGFDIHDAAWPNRAALARHQDVPAPAHDIIELILGMRLLRVGRAGAKDIQAGAQRWNELREKMRK